VTHYGDLSWEKVEEEEVSWLSPGRLAEGKITVLDGDPGVGKALCCKTLLPTPHGWTTMGGLTAGDTVIDDQGNPCTVVFTTEVMTDRPCYRMTFSDGTSIIADEEHLWSTTDRTTRHREAKRRWKAKQHTPRNLAPRPDKLDDGPRIRSTGDILRTLRGSDGRANHAIRSTSPLEGRHADLPVPPYTMGLWLADGNRDGGVITKPDQGVFDEVENDGFTCSHVYDREKGRRTVYGLVGHLRIAGVLNNKHIPPAYLRASIAQRRALLAGLLDGDGYQDPHNGVIEYTTVTPALRDGALELLRSLGYLPRCAEGRSVLNGEDKGPKWRVTFSTDESPFRLPRKRDAFKPDRRSTYGQRYIVACDPVESVPVRCIQVDSPSKLYLCGEGMIPTHNTTLWVDWAARVSSGRGLPMNDGNGNVRIGPEREPGGVLIFNGEDTVADTLKPRARIHGANMRNMHSIAVKPDNSPFLLPTDMPDLMALCDVLNIRMLVFDPIFSFMAADMMKGQQIRQGLAALNDYIAKKRIPCIFLRHFNKNNQSSVALYRGEGGIALNAVARVVLAAGLHPTDPSLRVLAPVKGNLSVPQPSLTYRIDPALRSDGSPEQHGRLTWVGSTEVTANELLAPASRHEMEDREDIWTWADGMIGEQGITVKELDKAAREMGYRTETVKEVLRAHGIRSKPSGKGGPGTYTHPVAYPTRDLWCAGCNGIRWRDDDVCANCGTKAVKMTRGEE
jgi:hypothetical protein